MKSNLPVALVTGSARRVGAEIVRLLHSREHNIIIHYRHSKADAFLLRDELNSLRSESAIALPADFEKNETPSTLVKAAVETWGRLDVLVNNASTYFPNHIGNTTIPQWHTLLSSNLQAPYFLCQAAAPYLRASKGCIVNITDIKASRPSKNYSVYCIAKAGLNMLTKALALELGPLIRVNAVAPGPTLWPEGINVLDDDAKIKSIEQSALKRKAEPRDIAAVVLFFIEQPHLTGQIINVDGGKLLYV